MNKLASTLLPAMFTVAIFGCGDSKSADPDAPITPGVDARRFDAPSFDAPSIDAPGIDAPPSNRGSLVFDGAGDFAQIPGTAAISTLNTITVEAWVKPVGTIRTRILTKPLTVGSQIALDRESDTRLFGETWSMGVGTRPSTSLQANLPAGTWSHIALTFSIDTLRIYVNGIEVGSSQSAQMATSLNDYFIGKSMDNTASFNGAIDELRIWKVARTQAQLQANRSVLLLGNEPNLVGYWNFDEGTGDLIHDKTSGNNTGRLGASVGADSSDPAWSTDKPF